MINIFMSGDEFAQSYLEVSRADLLYNAETVKEYVGCPIIAVVKCDGYGVSITEAAAAWKSCGVTMFGVSEPAEAIALRQAGYIDEDILLMTPVADLLILEKMIENDIILTVSGPSCARFYSKADDKKPVRVHIAVDTGMGRFGTKWTDKDELKEIYSTDNLHIEGIFSHFSASFEKKYKLTKIQLERFLGVTEYLSSCGFSPGIRHIANSCAALRFPDTRLDAVRIGSALVGRLSAAVPVSLKKVGVYRAMVVDRRTLRKGDTTGYASVCKIRRDTDVAVVAIGRQNGFGLEKRTDCFRFIELLSGLRQVVRSYNSRLYVEFCGKKLPVIGRIGSQYTLVDAGGTDLSPGDYVSAGVDMIFPAIHRKYV